MSAYKLHKSALFLRQLQAFAAAYRNDLNAGNPVALRFVDGVEAACSFIQKRPLACGIYHEASLHPDLKSYEFRKWRVKGFPHSIFFRIDGDVILLEAIYAHKMDIAGRLPDDLPKE